MFDLEQAISGWRRHMVAARLDAETLDELEGHLRDDVGQRVQCGETGAAAFAQTVRELGDGGRLKSEFARAGETISERWRRWIRAPAGLPEYQLATNMNAQNPEPGWATYLKSAALILPAIAFWIAACIFVVPKLKEICAASSTQLPVPVNLALTISQSFKEYFIYFAVGTLAAVVLLEWRLHWWPRYRRWVFRTIAYSVNLIALVLLCTLLLAAVMAGARLARLLTAGQ
ncbi:MAG TPA: hypothetical protein VFV81_10545 [Verrucomicrobiae bacterium]|nr:hypothetical protein [Verrucomicrobiae bacterium]